MAEEETPEQFRDRMRSVGFIGRRSGNRVKDGRSDSGVRYKVTTDELNNDVINSGPIDNERQDVIVRPNMIKKISANSGEG